MQSHALSRSVRATCCAPAKINLHLGVSTQRDGRGYHFVNSLMCPLDLHDQVQLMYEPQDCGISSCITLDCQPAVTGDPASNLAYKAAQAWLAAVPQHARIHISLEKRIPAQAGLGGGSSDAAAVLRCLEAAARAAQGTQDRQDMQDMHGAAPSSAPDLTQLAQDLGADTAFFLQDYPALYTRFGDIFERAYPPVLMSVVLVRPDAGVSTPAAYAAFDVHPVQAASLEPLEKALQQGSAAGVRAAVANNLTPASRSLLPGLSEVLQFLEDEARHRADGSADQSRVLLCGSGSCCAYLCSSDAEAARVVQRAQARGWWVCSTRTASPGGRKPKIELLS